VKRRIVLDSELGSDVGAALALALALGSPELELLALTTVGSESLLRARIAAKLLALAGREGIAVHAGCRVPLLGGGGFRWFGHEGEGILEPGEEPPVSPLHAVDALRGLLREQEDVHLVAIGPLTNIAAALVLEPDLAGRIASLTARGGLIRPARYGGRAIAPGADYNLCSDPHASYLVLRCGAPIRLVPLHVALASWLTESDLQRLAAHGTRFASALVSSVHDWTPLQRHVFARAGCDVDDDNAAFLHDPLALACLCDESFCEFDDLEIEPALEQSERLRTFERPAPSDATRPMRCATSVDARRFRAHFVERVVAAG
jgi:purine nucleosidase